MGYSLLRFVRSVDQHLRCSICSNALQSPVLTQCGHSFCQACLLTWLRESAQSEPRYPSRSFNRSLSTDVSHNIHNSNGPSSAAQSLLLSNGPQPHTYTDTQFEYPSLSQVNQGRQLELPGTCPECRSSVLPSELSPVICLRNLVLALEVTCEYSDRGCQASFPLEQDERHLETCGFFPVACVGCQELVNRSQIMAHHEACPAILRILQVDLGDKSHEFGLASGGHSKSNSIHRDALGNQQNDRQESRDLNTGSTASTLMDREPSSNLIVRRGRCLTSSPYTFTSRHSNSNNGNISSPNLSNRMAIIKNTEESGCMYQASNRNHLTLYDENERAEITTCANMASATNNRSKTTTGIRGSSPTMREQISQPANQASLALAQASCAAQVSRLLTRIGSLETQVGKLLDDLQAANSKNFVLNTEYRRIQKELLVRRRDKEVQTTQNVTCAEAINENSIRPDHDEICQLSMSIAQNLLTKPSFIDSCCVFRQLRSFYADNFLSNPPSVGRERNVVHDLHVLLATAYASNWFTTAQRTSLGLWLQHVLLTSRQNEPTTNHRYIN
ncbi:E3 ubiquitin-protein ligase pdzrn3 [Plakobranchus ocellatus]|uniref:E3 ubiquitin-protein ligase pdzrn3 n=1 Tax=Plakobranchus ocellatus TaxID=259542 RepID=A0AAV4B482_9GAST|nr:E3 ubiquitin-protein ligase pdzrn3 [Plakobranchus ocellatus]